MKQRKNLIIGMGKSGKAAYALLREVGESAIGFDDNTSTCQNLLKEGFEVTQNPQMHEFDRCIVSPGFPSNHFVIQQAISKGIPILGEAQLAFEMMSHTPQRRIGITGTNGKTTVTLLVTHVLNQAGQKAYALGNVGKLKKLLSLSLAHINSKNFRCRFLMLLSS
jgi:UDP-N-acetylmuramoylalanine--D-glutamate ligase